MHILWNQIDHQIKPLWSSSFNEKPAPYSNQEKSYDFFFQREKM